MYTFSRSFVLACCLVGIAGFHPAVAEETKQSATAPEVMTIVNKMKDVFEPATPRVATATITFTGEGNEKVRWVGRLARMVVGGEKRTLVVMLEPRDIKATAFLVEESQDTADRMWLYLPPINRIREIMPVETYQQFLGTDFTYADLGFVDRRGRYRLLSEEQHQGKRAYKIEFAPTDQWYYSRIITWVDVDTYMPIQRDFYDVANRLWRTQMFDQITVIDGHPTPLRIEMRDLQQGTSTIFTMSKVHHNEDLPETLFDPKHLRVAAGQSPLTVAAGEGQ